MLEKFSQGSSKLNTLLAALILAISVSLVLLVGLGDAHRNFPGFITDKIEAQGQIVRDSVETFLSSGLPLDQFAGFSRLSNPLDETDADIARISIIDPKGNVVFDLIDKDSKYLIANPSARKISESNGAEPFTESSLHTTSSPYKLLENSLFYQVVLPVKSKFEVVGNLEILMPKARISQHINIYFLYVSAISLFILGLFAFFAQKIYKQLQARSGNFSARGIDFSYGVAYLSVALAVVTALTLLYSEGIQAKTQAVTLSLGSRLNAPVEIGLKLSDFSGIEETFAEYKKLNPEISLIALRTGDKTEIATVPGDSVNQAVSDFNHFSYEVNLDDQQGTQLSLYAILVKTPKDILYAKLWRSVKNFLALFIASAFISNLFLNLLKSFTNRPEIGTDEYEVLELKKIEPFYFLGTFVDGLSISFLPQYLTSIAVNTGLDKEWVSTLFTVYFFGWALAMIPATKIIETRGVKPVLIWVGILNVVVAIAMSFVGNFYAMFLLRAIAGAGQGIFTVGVQYYILEIVSAQRRTQGNDMMVFAFSGARLSSAAIGALLSSYLGFQNVFMVGFGIALFSLWYVQQFIPEVSISRVGRLATQSHQAQATEINLDIGSAVQEQPQTTNDDPVEAAHKRLLEKEQSQAAKTTGTFFDDFIAVIKDSQFLKAILLIGLPYRAIFTGVTIFALPLLLSQQNYLPEDIGEIMMFYSAAVLVSSNFVSRWVDRLGHADRVLFLGTSLSGVGLFLIGLMSWAEGWESAFPFIKVSLVILGVSILGCGHGCINAPSLTYITETKVAKKIGQGTVGGIYRLMERGGQIIGPVLVAQMFLLWNDSAFTLSWIGMASIVLGVLFLFKRNSPKLKIS